MPGNLFPFLNEEWHMIIQGMDQPALHVPEVGRPAAAPHGSFVENTTGRVELVGVELKEITNVWVLLMLGSVAAFHRGETEHRVILIGDNPIRVVCVP